MCVHVCVCVSLVCVTDVCVCEEGGLLVWGESARASEGCGICEGVREGERERE